MVNNVSEHSLVEAALFIYIVDPIRWKTQIFLMARPKKTGVRYLGSLQYLWKLTFRLQIASSFVILQFERLYLQTMSIW